MQIKLVAMYETQFEGKQGKNEEERSEPQLYEHLAKMEKRILNSNLNNESVNLNIQALRAEI